jgi:hypothetical protein
MVLIYHIFGQISASHVNQSSLITVHGLAELDGVVGVSDMPISMPKS